MTTAPKPFCGKCGAPRVDTADKFCPDCGAPYAANASASLGEPRPIEAPVTFPETPTTMASDATGIDDDTSLSYTRAPEGDWSDDLGRRLFTFTGKATRGEYAVAYAIAAGILFIITFMGYSMGGGTDSAVMWGWGLGWIVSRYVWMCASAARLRDMGKDPALAGLVIVPGLGTVLLIWGLVGKGRSIEQFAQPVAGTSKPAAKPNAAAETWGPF